jgi:hypothetical protein
MRRLLLLWIAGLLTGSCGEKIFTNDVDCSECYWPEPDTGYITVKITINDEFKEVPVVVFKGDIEDNEIFLVDTATTNPFYIDYVPVNAHYSIRAEYKRTGSTLYAVDGTKIKTVLVSESCDGGDCYILENDDLNVEIKKDYNDF